jgi:NCAIR mutase (PurE)-related protein
MDRKSLRGILSSLKNGRITINQAIEKLSLCYESLEFANVDVGRELRTGVSEALLCEGKPDRQIVSIAQAIHKRSGRLLATRATPELYELVREVIPKARYNQPARTITVGSMRRKSRFKIAVVTAGTSDIPVAEEAAVTAEFLGNTVERIYDVGVAGIHRLLGHLEKIRKARVVIVVAGMEGALASVIGGMVSLPIIGVPTSVGYGASFEGVASLLTMLNSCAPGVTVVNIDNGFGAGVAASLINSKRR